MSIPIVVMTTETIARGQYARLWVSLAMERIKVTTYPLCGNASKPPEASAEIRCIAPGSSPILA